MRRFLQFIGYAILFLLLTALTQVGGLVLLMSKWLGRYFPLRSRWQPWVVFFAFYLLTTFVVVPQFAPLFGRERIAHVDGVRPTTYLTLALNRNYVKPELNALLARTATRLAGSGVRINYLDANFPFYDGFPLLPHLSHNDGRKLDLSLVYQSPDGTLSTEQTSGSGYGIYVDPGPGEADQTATCLAGGYWQYDFTKYLSLGRRNRDLSFSQAGTRRLLDALLADPALGKILLEPHLKTRLGVKADKVRFHGCHAVRHDDHLHLQL